MIQKISLILGIVPPLHNRNNVDSPDQYKKDKTGNINMEFLPSIELKPSINYSDYFDKYFGKIIESSKGNFYLTVNCNLSISDIVFKNISRSTDDDNKDKIHLEAEVKIKWSPQNNSDSQTGNPLSYTFSRTFNFYIKDLQTITDINNKTVGPLSDQNSIILKGLSSNENEKLFLSYSFFNILDNPSLNILNNGNKEFLRYIPVSNNNDEKEDYCFPKYWLIGTISGNGVTDKDNVNDIGEFKILNKNTENKIDEYVDYETINNIEVLKIIKLDTDKELCLMQQIQYLRYGDRYSTFI